MSTLRYWAYAVFIALALASRSTALELKIDPVRNEAGVTPSSIVDLDTKFDATYGASQGSGNIFQPESGTKKIRVKTQGSTSIADRYIIRYSSLWNSVALDFLGGKKIYSFNDVTITAGRTGSAAALGISSDRASNRLGTTAGSSDAIYYKIEKTANTNEFAVSLVQRAYGVDNIVWGPTTITSGASIGFARLNFSVWMSSPSSAQYSAEFTQGSNNYSSSGTLPYAPGAADWPEFYVGLQTFVPGANTSTCECALATVSTVSDLASTPHFAADYSDVASGTYTDDVSSGLPAILASGDWGNAPYDQIYAQGVQVNSDLIGTPIMQERCGVVTTSGGSATDTRAIRFETYQDDPEVASGNRAELRFTSQELNLAGNVTVSPPSLTPISVPNYNGAPMEMWYAWCLKLPTPSSPWVGNDDNRVSPYHDEDGGGLEIYGQVHQEPYYVNGESAVGAHPYSDYISSPQPPWAIHRVKKSGGAVGESSWRFKWSWGLGTSTSPDQTAGVDLGDVALDTWTKFVIRVVYYNTITTAEEVSTSGNGVVEIWVNGTKKFGAYGIRIGSIMQKCYFKQGIYAHKWNNQPSVGITDPYHATAFYDNLQVIKGTSTVDDLMANMADR